MAGGVAVPVGDQLLHVEQVDVEHAGRDVRHGVARQHPESAVDLDRVEGDRARGRRPGWTVAAFLPAPASVTSTTSPVIRVTLADLPGRTGGVPAGRRWPVGRRPGSPVPRRGLARPRGWRRVIRWGDMVVSFERLGAGAPLLPRSLQSASRARALSTTAVPATWRKRANRDGTRPTARGSSPASRACARVTRRTFRYAPRARIGAGSAHDGTADCVRRWAWVGHVRGRRGAVPAGARRAHRHRQPEPLPDDDPARRARSCR